MTVDDDMMTVMVRIRCLRSTYHVPSPVRRVLTEVITKYLSRNNNVLGLELDSYEEQETHTVPLSLRCGHVNHNRQQL